MISDDEPLEWSAPGIDIRMATVNTIIAICSAAIVTMVALWGGR